MQLLAPEEALLLDLDDQLRRSACDRCRAQKLRCERPQSGNPATSTTTSRPSSSTPLPPCRRCQRANAVCNTSFQQRPGRPRLSASSDDQRRSVGGHQKQTQSRAKRQPRKLSYAFSFNSDSLRLADDDNANERGDDASLDSAVAGPFARPHRERSLSPGERSPTSSGHFLSPAPLSDQGRDQVLHSDDCPDSLVLRLDQSAALSSNHMKDDWDMGSCDTLQSWSWNVECEQTLSMIERPCSDEPVNFGLSTPAHSVLVSSVECQPPAPSKLNLVASPVSETKADLCQRLADLGHSLCSQVHHLTRRVDRGPPLDAEDDEEDASFIERAFQSSEKFRGLLDDLRAKESAATTPSLPELGTGALTPCSTLLTGAAASGPGGGGGGGGGPSDSHLDMILGLHVAAAYVALNRILYHALRGVHAAVSPPPPPPSSSATGAGCRQQRARLPRLPGVRMAGLTCVDDDDGLRARLFAETCSHVATGIHCRLEALAGAGVCWEFAQPLNMVLGRGQQAVQSDVDVRGIKELCAQISAAVQKRAW